VQEIIVEIPRMTATSGAAVMMDFLLARDSVLDGLCPLEAIAAGEEMRARVLRLLRAEAADGFS
jgi:hypothetical protein